MASDDNPGGWAVPDGYKLTRHEGYWMNSRGFRRDEKPEDGDVFSGIGVAHFDEAEPFVLATRQVVVDGVTQTIEGWSPNATIRMIEDGYAPPVFTLVHKDDPTPLVEPARAHRYTDDEVAAMQADDSGTGTRLSSIPTDELQAELAAREDVTA